MKKKDLLKKLHEKTKRKAQPIKLKLDFDRNQDGAPDVYKSDSEHSDKKQSNKTPDFYSQNFNDEGTNVRPLHKNKDGKRFKTNKHTGDDHIHKGNDFEVDDKNKPSVGNNSWTGDDHLFEVIDEISTKILYEHAVKQNKKYLLKKKLK